MSDATASVQHRRRNPLTGRWVLVSPQRTERPWQGAVSNATSTPLLRHDPTCHLCPGNRRANGSLNPDYRGVYVFDNDFPAMQRDLTEFSGSDTVFCAEPVRGQCRVICYSPDHDRSMSSLSPIEIRAVVDCWVQEYSILAKEFRWVQIFENKGEMMGCSNPHPHGQIWAADHLPDEAKLEDAHQRDFYEAHGVSLLAQVASREASADRIIAANEHWLALVPWWATWPFESLLLPRFPAQRFTDLNDVARTALAALLSDLTRRYDALFRCDFPYSMGWHGAPGLNDDAPHWQLHAHFYPPLLRSATVRKFMVGYEMLAEPQRDLTPEAAAQRLRDVLAS